MDAGSPVRRARGGPSHAVPTWEEIVDRHSDRVYRLALRLTGNRHDAEDLTQEVFVRVFRSLVDLHARHLRGLDPPDHHQPLPRPGPPQAADPLRRPLRRARRPAPQRAADARHGVRRPAPSTTTSSAPCRRCRRSSGPPSCSATSRACPTRRSPQILDAKLGTVRSRIHRGRAMLRAGARPPRPGRRPHPLPADPRRCPRRPTSCPGRVVIGHLGARVSALLDGQLSPADEERAWDHVHSCHQCRDAGRARGLGQDPAGRPCSSPAPPRRRTSRARCSCAASSTGPAWPTRPPPCADGRRPPASPRHGRHRRRRRRAPP